MDFQEFVRTQKHNTRYFYEVYNNATGNKYIEANWSGYFKGITLVNDLTTFFN